MGRDVLELWSKMAECATFRQRIRAMEECLLPFAARARGRTLIMRAAQHILVCKGAVRIDEIAFHAALSVRQFERRFAEEAGMAPKLFALTARFQNALDAKRSAPSRSWLVIAHEFGYFDQMHLIRDFQRLGGSAPNGILEQGGDIQPWSLAPHQSLEMK
jgi:transcriptional regulator GlxA family with amidase domain